MLWLLLVLSLPTENATARMRAWRALKASGAAVLRDGVYLLPDREICRSTLASVAGDVLASGGSAHLLRADGMDGAEFTMLFDRGEDYAALIADVEKAREALTADTTPEVTKQARKLRKSFAALADIDFFPGEAQRQAEAAIQELEASAARILSPDEPHAVAGAIPRLNAAEYRGRIWATRRRPWVDRLACAWLIRRFIDRDARILWLESPADCPPAALGFDFDGATFSHVGARVSFEVLLASFGLDASALARIGALVHFLDIGGVQPPEASGIERVLAGLRESITDDDRLLQAAAGIFDGLLAAFKTEKSPS